MRDYRSNVYLSSKIADIIQQEAVQIALNGGVQAVGAREKAKQAAEKISVLLDLEQQKEIKQFINKESCLIVFTGLHNKNIDGSDIVPPEHLSSLEVLENDIECIKLAATNQILLELVNQFAFAYDIDNYGKIMRLVGNFKGGGVNKLNNEKAENVDKSYHSGIALSAHTEAPYHCVSSIYDGHSPAPSSLILTARWNPLSEPTTVIPVAPILNKLDFEEVLALSTSNFDFTRSETFTEGKGTGGEKVSILEIDKNGRVGMKYNSYRFTANRNAPDFVKKSLEKFVDLIKEAHQEKINLQPDTSVIINNTTALHCRDIIQDNRRLLVRLFGYRDDIEYISLRNDPPLVRG